ncbi:MAG: class II fumarate hydratase [bacterium]
MTINTDLFRIEKDPIGEVLIPKDKLWGPQTQRAINNFQISNYKFHPEIIKALLIIKKSAAIVNNELNLIDSNKANAIINAVNEILNNFEKYQDNFVLDIFQTGSATSLNMNVNEVISNLACILLNKELGSKFIHPNDDVNKGQSSNDVIPTSIRIAVYKMLVSLINDINYLINSIKKKEEEFRDVVKIGRTHLMDATPITFSQEFSGYRRQLELAIDRITGVFNRLSELPIGGTAVGTGINTHVDFPSKVVNKINEFMYKFIPFEIYPKFRETSNHFEAQASIDTFIEVMDILKILALSLIKITNDIRFMGSGPVGGFTELFLPELQAGSSIMPGKVNPVIPEAVGMACSYIVGLSYSLTFVNQYSNFELSTTFPLVAFSLTESISILSNLLKIIKEKLMDGLKINFEKINTIVNYNPSIVTPLAKIVGYDKAYEIVKEALKNKLSIKEYVVLKNILSPEEAEKILNPLSLTKPGI